MKGGGYYRCREVPEEHVGVEYLVDGDEPGIAGNERSFGKFYQGSFLSLKTVQKN